MNLRAFVVLAAIAIGGCSSSAPTMVSNESKPDNPTITNVAITFDWPASLRPFGDGYPASGDPCRRLGESAATSDYLDDSADLVGCPTAQQAKALGGRTVGQVDGVTLVSVPKSVAPSPKPTEDAAATKPADPIRGKGGLEEKCLAKVAETTGARVIGVNRIEQAGSAVSVYVNVENAQAPWRCRGTAEGKLIDAEYSGSEGEL